MSDEHIEACARAGYLAYERYYQTHAPAGLTQFDAAPDWGTLGEGAKMCWRAAAKAILEIKQ